MQTAKAADELARRLEHQPQLVEPGVWALEEREVRPSARRTLRSERGVHRCIRVGCHGRTDRQLAYRDSIGGEEPPQTADGSLTVTVVPPVGGHSIEISPFCASIRRLAVGGRARFHQPWW